MVDREKLFLSILLFLTTVFLGYKSLLAKLSLFIGKSNVFIYVVDRILTFH